MKIAKDLWMLVRLYYHLPSILVNIVDRIIALEERKPPEAYQMRTIYVPCGMSTEVAWEAHKDGELPGRKGRKERVLVDENENLLAIMR